MENILGLHLAFIAFCMGVIMLVLLVWTGFIIYVLLQVRRTALAAEALAYEAREQVARLREATSLVHQVATLAGSGWMKILGAAVGAAAALWVSRSHPPRE
ncbi:MAG TPA: hypothetical protein DCM05_06000 [Elusimicrobia bacterium]|nr:hypothetical protein [Elusimicrobiota bacterium]